MISNSVFNLRPMRYHPESSVIDSVEMSTLRCYDILGCRSCSIAMWTRMPNNLISRRQRRVKRFVKKKLRQGPPGPNRPRTSDWILRLRDNAHHEFGGYWSQLLKLVKRVVRGWGKVKIKRNQKCIVTEWDDLKMAVNTLLEGDQGPAALRRSLFRSGVTKLNESSARILRSKALPLVAAKKAHVAAEAEFVCLERQDELLSNWHRLVQQSLLSVIKETFKEHQNAKDRAAREHQGWKAAALKSLRLSLSEHLLHQMTSAFAEIHSRERQWHRKSRHLWNLFLQFTFTTQVFSKQIQVQLLRKMTWLESIELCSTIFLKVTSRR